MVKTKKNNVKNNVTKKNLKLNLALCPIGLKPFEAKFNKTLSISTLKKIYFDKIA
jgi:hypothetical protein